MERTPVYQFTIQTDGLPAQDTNKADVLKLVATRTSKEVSAIFSEFALSLGVEPAQVYQSNERPAWLSHDARLRGVEFEFSTRFLSHPDIDGPGVFVVVIDLKFPYDFPYPENIEWLGEILALKTGYPVCILTWGILWAPLPPDADVAYWASKVWWLEALEQ
jgi:hypothetical protein